MSVTYSGEFGNAQAKGAAINARYMTLLYFVLTGYAVAGKGFAYVGIKPLFIGDVTMVIGIIVFLRTANLLDLLRDRLLLFIALYMAWGAWRTIPGLHFGMDALRDSVIWAYGSFAFIVANALASHEREPRRLIDYFQRLAYIAIWAFPVVFVCTQFLLPVLPQWPGTDVPIIFALFDQEMVHFVGLSVFLMGGVISLSPAYVVAIVMFAVACAAELRAAAVGAMAALSLTAVLAPVRRHIMKAVLLLAAIIALLWITDAKVTLINRREISVDAFVAQVTSISEGFHFDLRHISREDRNSGSITWRLIFWAFLVDKVWTDAPVNGLGFGETLALKGLPFKVEEDRSPHNGTVTILARMGFVGLALWIAMLGVWFHGIISAQLRAVRERRYIWASIFMALAAYVLASLACASLGVFLEGPMGGIWFWCLIGMGAAMRRWYLAWPDYWTESEAESA
ncbi:MAG: O-antigen ligase family protein [Rhizomicrobium sp.]